MTRSDEAPAVVVTRRLLLTIAPHMLWLSLMLVMASGEGNLDVVCELVESISRLRSVHGVLAGVEDGGVKSTQVCTNVFTGEGVDTHILSKLITIDNVRQVMWHNETVERGVTTLRGKRTSRMRLVHPTTYMYSDVELRGVYAGYTALHCAAANGHVDVIKHLVLVGGADVDRVDINGYTAMHRAASGNQARAIRTLLNVGATTLNATQACGFTPLMCAARLDAVNAVLALVVSGADTTLRDMDEFTALEGAISNGFIECSHLLMRTSPAMGAEDARAAQLVASDHTSCSSIQHAIDEAVKEADIADVVDAMRHVENDTTRREMKINTGRMEKRVSAMTDAELTHALLNHRDGGRDDDGSGQVGHIPHEVYVYTLSVEREVRNEKAEKRAVASAKASESTMVETD